jgi:hypothetical protein
MAAASVGFGSDGSGTHRAHAPLTPPLSAPELRDDGLVEFDEAHPPSLKPLAKDAKQVAVAADAVRPVLLVRERRGVGVEVRTEEPGAVAAEDLSPREVVVQHVFSFGGVSAARRSHPDYAASWKALMPSTARRCTRLADRRGITRRSA